MATTEEISSAPPGLDERYECAANTSNLRVQADKGGSADILIAAGMSEARLGMMLLRLHSEWDSSAKPRKVTPEGIKALSLTMPDGNGKPDIQRARREAAAWYASELRLLAQSLKSRAGVIEQLITWGALKGLNAETVAQSVYHWLDSICPACEGHGLHKDAGSPALSARRCHACDGGHRYAPTGSARVLMHIDYALQQARNSLKRRLRP